MRLFSVVIVLGALVASVHGALASDSKITTHISSLLGLVEQNDVPTQRFLRTYETTEDAEERVGGIEKFTNLFKPSTSKLIDPTKLHDEKAGVKLFKKFDFGDDIVAALGSSKLSTAIKTFNEKHSSTKITLIGTLSAHYGDDVVAKALVTAQKDATNPELASLATKLRAEQFSTWMTNGKNVDRVFKLLKFSDDGSNALTSRRYEVLNDYINFYNKRKGEHNTLLSTFTTAFDGESNVVSIIATAKTDRLFGGRARKLESDLLEKWKNDKMQPERLMNVLKLDNDVETVFDSDKLRTFIKYISKFNENNHNSEVSLLGTLTAKYGEVDVAKALVSAKSDRTTEALATKLQMEQMEGWLKNDMSVGSVFTLLKGEDKGLDTVFSRKLETLKAYIGFFNREKSEDETLIKTLTAAYGGEIEFVKKLEQARAYPATHTKATDLQNMIFQQWMNEGVTSMTVLVKKLDAKASGIRKSIEKSFAAFYEKTNLAESNLVSRRS